MAYSGWFCWLVRRKEVNFVVLLVHLGLVGFSRASMVSKVRVGIRVSVRIRVSLVLVIGWYRTSQRGVSGVVGFWTCRHSRKTTYIEIHSF